MIVRQQEEISHMREDVDRIKRLRNYDQGLVYELPDRPDAKIYLVLQIEGTNPTFYARKVSLFLWTKKELASHRICDQSPEGDIVDPKAAQSNRTPFKSKIDLEKIEKLKG